MNQSLAHIDLCEPSTDDEMVSELAYAREDSEVMRVALESPNVSEETKQHFRDAAVKRQRRLEELGEYEAAAQYAVLVDQLVA